jgi:hypothetical protein
MVVDFLKWHKDRAIDLTNARIDLTYFIFTGMFAMLPKPLNLTTPEITQLVEKVQKRTDEIFVKALKDLAGEMRK